MEVQRSELSEQLEDFLQLRQRFTLGADTTIVPVVNAFNLDDPPFHGKQGLIWSGQVAAAAAKYATVVVAARPNTIVVIRYGGVTQPNLTALSWGAELTGVTQLTTGLYAGLVDIAGYDWDHRAGADVNGVRAPLQLAAASISSPPLAHYPIVTKGQLPASIGFQASLPGPVVLRAGDVLKLFCEQVNTVMNFDIVADIYGVG